MGIGKCDGDTPLHLACRHGNEEVVRFLIDQERERISKELGGDPACRSYNRKNNEGLSAAFCTYYAEIVELFLDLDQLEVGTKCQI